MRLTFGVPYMAKYGAKWRLSVVVVHAPARVGAVLVARWSVQGQKWSKLQLLAGGICREATELDCVSRGLLPPRAKEWSELQHSLKRAHGGVDGVDVPWEMSATFNFTG